MILNIVGTVLAVVWGALAIGLVIAVVGQEIALFSQCDRAGGILVQHTCVPRLQIEVTK